MNKFCLNICSALLLFLSLGRAYASEKVLDIREEKFQDDKALPSSADRGPSMMIYPYFERKSYACPYDYASFEEMCKLLQKAGITELQDFAHEKISPSDMHYPLNPDLDSKDKLVEIAGKYGIDKIWLVFGWRAYGAPMSATDKRVNVMCSEFLEEQYRFIDAVAKKNKQYGKNIFGLWLDEPWFGSDKINFDVHLDTFKEFCEKEYGEIYTGTTMPISRTPGSWWKQDASQDKWTRRFLVFQYCVYENFFKAIHKYAKSKDIKIVMRSMYTPVYAGGWTWGLDPYRVSKIGDYQWLPLSFLRLFNYENSICGNYKTLGPADFCRGMRGYPVDYFIYDMYLNYPKNTLRYNELVNLSKQWLGAERIADVAVLTYPVGILGGFKNPREVFMDNDNMFWATMDKLCPSDMIDVRDTRFYSKYRILIAPRYCGWSVPQYVIDNLKKFVNNGGTLISFDAKFAIGKRDLTDPKNVSEQLYGFDFLPENIAVGEIRFTDTGDAPTFKGKNMTQKKIRIFDSENVKALAVSIPGNEPVILEKTMGKGKIIYVNLDFAERVKKEQLWSTLPALLAARTGKFSARITAGLRFQSVIGKDGHAMLSISDRDWGMDYMLNNVKWQAACKAIPDETRGILTIDPESLKLRGEAFQVVALSENMFIANASGSKTWSREELKNGIPVKVLKETGYENIVIEPFGQKHEGKGIAARLRDVQVQWDKDVEQARLHPKGIGTDPLRKRIIIEKSNDVQDKPVNWQSTMRNRFIIDVTAPLDIPLNNQPLILGRKELSKLAGLEINSVELYRDGEKNKIEVQLDKDEIIFMDDFKNTVPNRYALYFDQQSVKPEPVSSIEKTNRLETPFYSAEIDNNGRISISGCGNIPGLQLNGTGGFEVAASSYRNPGKLHWTDRGPIRYMVEFTSVDNGISFKSVYEFFKGSPYIKIAYSSSQDNPLRPLEQFFYWPIGHITGKENRLEFLAGPGNWNKCGSTKENWSFMPFAENTYVLVKEKDSGFAWVLLSSTFIKPPYIMIGAKQLYFITRFGESHLTPVLVKKPYAEFMYIAGVSTKNDAQKELEILKKNWIIKIKVENNR